MRPTSCTATTRSTRTSPVPASTATCAIWQPNVLTRKPSGFGPRAPEPSIVASPSFSVTSVDGHVERAVARADAAVAKRQVVGGDLEHVGGEPEQQLRAPWPPRSARPACTEGVVIEPPATGP